MPAEQCQDKWKALKRTYKAVKDRLATSGSEGKKCGRFEHYDAMDAILSDRPSTACATTISTMRVRKPTAHVSPAQQTMSCLKRN